jgi:hypothetical protein
MSTPAVRCQAHGLVYDPSSHSGCVICRREAGEEVFGVEQDFRPPSHARSYLAFAGLSLALVVGGYFAYRAMKSEVGEKCGTTFGCVAGAQCLAFSDGPLPPILAEKGTCFASCEDDASCPSGQTCRSAADGRFCVRLAKANEPCGGAVACIEDATCLSRADGRFRCRVSCKNDSDCPDRHDCEQIVVTDPMRRMLSPEHLPYAGFGMSAGHYCMPVPD